MESIVYSNIQQNKIHKFSTVLDKKARILYYVYKSGLIKKRLRIFLNLVILIDAVILKTWKSWKKEET